MTVDAETARLQEQVKNLRCDLKEIKVSLDKMDQEVQSLREWRRWVIGVGATVGVVIGLFANRIKTILGI